MRLGINIDHVATLRNARDTRYPSPIEAALVAETAGADFITMHLREDRRHIREEDVRLVQESISTHLNLEMALTEEMLEYALHLHPTEVCLVPEKRQEITTEGGLDVLKHRDTVSHFVARLSAAGIKVSLFIDPDEHQITAAAQTLAPVIELHTGRYANLEGEKQKAALEELKRAAYLAHELELQVNAGHGLTLHNVRPIAAIRALSDLNIGHAIIAHALFVGLPKAVATMKEAIKEARHPSLYQD